ncbi:MAG TPA: HAD family hydrolase [Desulfomonilia bacterium]
MIEAVLFDVGGVLFDEGYRKGLHAIAQRNGIDPLRLEIISDRLILETGYLTGKAEENVFWEGIRHETGIMETDDELRDALIERFVPREWMFEIVGKLKDHAKLAILSDQTNWLDIMEERHHFFNLFDTVLNSYYTGRSKVDQLTFDFAASVIGFRQENILFVDDRIGNIKRAEASGCKTILYSSRENFLKDIEQYFPDITNW